MKNRHSLDPHQLENFQADVISTLNSFKARKEEFDSDDLSSLWNSNTEIRTVNEVQGGVAFSLTVSKEFFFMLLAVTFLSGITVSNPDFLRTLLSWIKAEPYYIIGSIIGIAILLFYFFRRLKIFLKERRRKKLEKALLEAKVLVQKNDIKKLICPTLLSVTGDVFEYSKTITPILMAAIIAKTIIMPLDAMIFAAIAIVVAKSGASVICAGHDK